MTSRATIPTTLLLLTLFSVLTSCAALNKAPADLSVANIAKHRQQLSQLKHWKLEGKLGYQDRQQGGSALLQWRQNQDAFELHLSGPFGIKATRIFGNDQHAELQQSGVTHYTASSASELTIHLFGWAWPVDELFYWIKGLPAPNTTIATQLFDHQGLLTELQQSGWQLTFSEYQRAENLILPGKISGNSGDLRFTLVIKDWRPE